MGKGKRSDVLLTPVVDTAATLDLAADPAGLTFRKKILPLGTIEYPDPESPGGTRRVTFDRAYHDTLIDAYGKRAVECPTVQLAGPNNQHNMDLGLTAGEVTGLSRERPGDADGPGLYADIRARNEKHARLLHEMPRLGVSAQIKEKFGRVDGSKFRAALRHILVTADPRVVGLGPWRAVSLSTNDGDGPVIDLSDGDYEEIHMPDVPTGDGVLSLSDDELEAALAEAAAEMDDLEPDDTGGDTVSVSGGGGSGGTATQLSDVTGTLRSFAAGLGERDVTIRGMQAQLAGSNWKAERLELSNAGVPKYLLDEAEKVLKYPGESVVSLADEDGREFTADARGTIRRMLELCRGVIDLAEPAGSGAGDLDLSDEDEVARLAELAERQFGV
jgi:hypothetical protein